MMQMPVAAVMATVLVLLASSDPSAILRTDAFGTGRPVQRHRHRHETNRLPATHASTAGGNPRCRGVPGTKALAQSSTALGAGLFGGIFGGGGGGSAPTGGDEHGNGAVLAEYGVGLPGGDNALLQQKLESLSSFVTKEWAGLFASGGITLTTPVKVSRSGGPAGEGGAVCRLVFEKVDTGYGDKDKDDGNENENTTKNEKKEQAKQGGVEVSVLPPGEGRTTATVRVTRCEMDGNTMVKEMSEERILRELRDAIAVWEKESAL
ncbi:unnamed protein product [Pseudo-nitzschia multistriata]|uniref:COMM domain-containing protein n=1 Tax=Pseudo-nitzschia multistriata TaxID=183589 RepID=A0A448Z7X4_9STRA|nr:unnamed protein product [Pseudo-nitzschia multistriata]